MKQALPGLAPSRQDLREAFEGSAALSLHAQHRGETAAMSAARLSWILFGLFAALGVADYALTLWYLRPVESVLGESNLVAGWVLRKSGWLGLAGFKAASIGVAGGACALLWQRRRALVPYVLGLACLITGGVILFSLGLGIGARQAMDRGAGSIPEIEEKKRDLAKAMAQTAAFLDVVRVESKKLREGRTSLVQAVAVLCETEKARDPEWIEVLVKTHPPLTKREEVLAAVLVQNALVLAPEGAARQALGDELERQFRTRFGQGLPSLQARPKTGPPPARPAPSPVKPAEMEGPTTRMRVD